MKNGELISELFRLPVRDIEEIAPGTALILAPHPDDESLGCGGFIAEAVARGRPPVVVIVSDGSGSHPASREWPEERLTQQREKEAREAARILGLPRSAFIFWACVIRRFQRKGRNSGALWIVWPNWLSIMIAIRFWSHGGMIRIVIMKLCG